MVENGTSILSLLLLFSPYVKARGKMSKSKWYARGHTGVGFPYLKKEESHHVGMCPLDYSLAKNLINLWRNLWEE